MKSPVLPSPALLLRYSLLLLFLLSGSLISRAATAQDTVVVVGYIQDAFHKRGMNGWQLHIYTPDSIEVENHSADIFFERNDSALINIRTVIAPGDYLLRASKEGYTDVWQKFTVERGKNVAALPRLIQMRRGFNVRQLGEAVVRPTRIKVKMRGDTLVYDARAFEMPDGSMLNHLIEQLPGATLNAAGEIFIRGRKLDEITLSARTLFGGNQKVLLENLPYYTVKELKVFERLPLSAVLSGDRSAAKRYVMDIALKDEYSMGYSVNGDFAAGTRERYLGKLFGFLLTKTMTVGGFVNFNNINDETRTMWGNWGASSTTWGIMPDKRRGAGVSINYQSKQRGEGGYAKYSSDTEIYYDLRQNTGDQRYFSETFLPASLNAYNSQKAYFLKHERYVEVKEKFHLMPWKLQGELRVSYKRKNNNSHTDAHQWYGTREEEEENKPAVKSNSTRAEEDQLTTTSQRAEWLTYGKEYGLDHAHLQWSIPKVKSLILHLDGSIKHSEQEDFSRTTSLRQEALTDYRHDYQANKSRRYHVEPKLGYYRHIHALGLGLSVDARYRLQGERSDDNIFLLSRLEGWGATDSVQLNLIPSNRDLLLRAFDSDNSEYRDQRTQEGEVKMELRLPATPKRKLELHLVLPLYVRQERMDYARHTTDTLVYDRYLTFNPQLNVVYRQLKLGIAYEGSYAGLRNRMPYRDERNPFFIYEGNPSLDNNRALRVNGRWLLRFDRDALFSSNYLELKSDFHYRFRSVAQGFTYNPATSVYTYRPENVKGNWTWNGSIHLTHSLGKRNEWRIENTLSTQVFHSVDYASLSGQHEAQLNKVENVMPKEAFQLNYSTRSTKLTLNGEVTWRRTWGHHAQQPSINAFDYSYGIKGQHTIRAWKTTFELEGRMNSRRGYASSMMNKDEFLLNAAITQSLLKGRMTLRLEGLDILSQCSGTSYSVNAQGRSETWMRLLPNYFMLHLTYRLDQKPKKP